MSKTFLNPLGTYSIIGLALIQLGLFPYPVQEEHQQKLIGFVNKNDL